MMPIAWSRKDPCPDGSAASIRGKFALSFSIGATPGEGQAWELTPTRGYALGRRYSPGGSNFEAFQAPVDGERPRRFVTTYRVDARCAREPLNSRLGELENELIGLPTD